MSDPVVQALLGALGERGVLTRDSDRARFETGWRCGKGIARCIVRPGSTAEVRRRNAAVTCPTSRRSPRAMGLDGARPTAMMRAWASRDEPRRSV